MKKLLVVLLSVLLLFSFTSCEKDKSAEVQAEYEAKIKAQQEKNEELVKNFEDFLDAYKDDISYLKVILVADYDNTSMFRFQPTQGNVNVTLSGSCYPEFGLDNFKDLIPLEDGRKASGPTHIVTSDPAPSGTVSGTATGTSNFDLRYTENKVTISYTVYDSDNNIVESDQKFEVTIDGTYKEVDNDDVHTVDYNVTINTKTYQMSYTYDKKAGKVTAASVNGKDVEIRLINAEDADNIKVY